jgi:GT2 family glycosyltransferase
MNLMTRKKLSSSKVFVILANWNGREVIRKCLKSFAANTFQPESQVVAVDNASVDGSIEMLEKEFPWVKLIRNKRNLGFSKATNQGLRYALNHGAEHILLLNSDIEITEKKWLTTMLRVFEYDNRIGIVGCKLLYPDGRIQHAGGIISVSGVYHRGDRELDNGQYDQIQFVDYVTGAAFLIKSEAICKTGLLDEGFSPLYCEDTDLCVRARLYGYKVAYTPKPALIHKFGSSSSALKKEQIQFYFRKSWIRFFLLNFKLIDILKRILTFESKELVRCIINRNRKGKLPLIIRGDAPAKLVLLAKAWIPNIRNLREIAAKREQRFLFRKASRLQRID